MWRRAAGALETPDDERHRSLELEYEAGVEYVLTRRAPVNVPRRGRFNLFHLLRQVTHQRNRHIPVVCRFSRYGGCVVQPDVRCRSNWGDGKARHDAKLRLHVRQRSLDVQHRLKLRSIRKVLGDVGVAEERGQEISHTSKKTVSPVPCITRLKTY
jgi:hypothetical protein